MQERREGYINMVADIAAMKQTLVDMASDMKELKDAKIAQNGRIGKLENWKWFIMGAIAIVGFILHMDIKNGFQFKIGMDNHQEIRRA